jgi:hypothetical protein
MLTGTCLSNNPGFTHFPGQKDLPDGIVDFMGTGVVEVFSFEIDLASVFCTQPFGMV